MRQEKDRPGSERRKAPTGIDGLDSITGGGFPGGRLTTVQGGPGAGKTVLALQSLLHGTNALDEPGIFVAFEEHSTDIMANAACFGWDLPGALRKKKLFFLDAQPATDTVQTGDFDLGGLLAALDVQIAQMKARRIVFDAIDVLLSMLASDTARRRELFRLRDWLSERSLTTIITAKKERNPGGGDADALQFMADCAVELEQRFANGRSQRTLHVLKYRGSRFHENDTPYIIGDRGLNVASVGAVGPRSAVTNERISSGIERLDTMLGGGFHRNAGILVTGAPGTAKTTLSSAFAEAACRRGEPTLFVSFDSDTAEIVRNMASVSISLQPHVGTSRRPGLLKMLYARALEGSAETHLLEIQALAHAHGARCVVIDPISALAMPGNEVVAQSVAKRMMDWAKGQGITLFLNSLLENGRADSESSPMQVSTIADTWLHLSYLVRGGERNRCLSLVKSRGTAHSNQVRELLLTADGVTLTDAYTAGGEVLLGTLRWEHEEAEKAARRAAERSDGAKRVGLSYLETDLVGRMARLQRKLDATRQQLRTAEETKVLRRVNQSGGRSHLSKLRGGDAEPGKPGKSGKSGRPVLRS